MSTVEKLMELAAARFKKDVTALRADGDIFDSLGIDSMQVMSLLTEVEMSFDVEIPDYELRDVKTFAQLAERIDERL